MLNLKNNFIMPAIKLAYGNSNGDILERHLDFYKRRAKHIGAIIPEPLFMDKSLRELPTQIGIDNNDKLDGLKKLTAILHKEDCKAIAHLNHPGRMANPKIPNNYFISSTDKACENGGATPKRATIKDIKDIIKLFKDSAIRAKKANFDMIELQFGHGYLVSQFLSQKVNDRDDNYGGSFENRARLALEIFEEVKSAVNIPIMVRVSGSEMIPDGISTKEIIQLVKELEKRGAVAIHVTAGSLCSTPPWFFHHMFVPGNKTKEIALKIKKEISIPIIPVGQINTKEDITKLRKNFDYLSVGKALIADPDFIGKILGEIKEPYRPCLSCMEGCLGGVKSGKGLGCMVNPRVNKDENEKLIKVDRAKKIAIIGGGLAGMEAGITLKKRGHSVDIYEKDNLGGQFNLASLPPKKEKLKDIVDYYKNMIIEYKIPIHYEEISKELISKKNYEAVVIATGATPVIPPIKGLRDYYWAEILKQKNIKNKKILVIGGGLIGVETAHFLLNNGNRVILVEMLKDVANNMEMISRKLTLKSFNNNPNIEIYKSTQVIEVDQDKVTLKGEINKVIENIDKIVVATGMKPFHYLEKELIGIFSLYLIGDALKVGKAQDAITDGYLLGKRL